MIMLSQRTLVAAALSLAACGASAWVVMAAESPATQKANEVPSREAKKKNPIPADEGSRTTGQKIYATNCAPCHGAGGKGDGSIAAMQEKTPADLTNARYAKETDGTLYWMISNGHPPMPHFSNTLPEESRWNVVNYLRTFTKAAATQPETRP